MSFWSNMMMKLFNVKNDSQLKSIGTFGQSFLAGLSGRYTGSNLTPAEVQANMFNASEAEKARQFSSSEAAIARNFEMDLANTAKQRQVADLQKAGLNPMLAADSGVVLPSASNASASVASSVSPGASAFNLSGLLSALGNLSLVDAQRKNIEADTKKKEAETGNIETDTERTIVQIQGSKLDNRAKEITNSYLERQQVAELTMKEADVEYKQALSDSLYRQIKKMDAEEAEIMVRICETVEKIQLLQKQQNLTDAQCAELYSLVNKYNREAELIGLNIKNFDNITVLGNGSANVGFGPFKVGESHPITLAEIKAHAEKVAKDKREQKEQGSKKDWFKGTQYEGSKIID